MAQKQLICIVDDDDSVREAAKALMKSLGFAAETFASAEGFLKFNHLNRVSCLIADVQMPGMTGLELHTHLASSGIPIPTILVTAYPDDRVRMRALKAGVICYLTKPFAEQDLLACIDSALEHVKANEERS